MLNTASSRSQVVSLPMRDGNSIATFSRRTTGRVVSLPMRDGNHHRKAGAGPGVKVVSLPMRDGNIIGQVT